MVTEISQIFASVYFYASANRQILISENIVLWNFIIRTPTFDIEPKRSRQFKSPFLKKVLNVKYSWGICG